MHKPNRRQILQAAGIAAAVSIVPRHVLGQGQTPPSEKLNIAGIGIGGQGAGDLGDMSANTPCNIVGLCDVDWKKASGQFNKFPKAQRHRDYRVMLDKQKDFDAVMIATPDHMHAPITLAALRAGKHVYVEKPMAHSIEEARLMAQVAKETGLVTQMGNNGHAGEGLRQTREWILAGAIGTVKEVHCWTDRPGLPGKRPWWPQPVERPAQEPVPGDLNWDLFLGAAPARPYSSAYHPFKWRGWFDFGTGAVGDMAVHNMDPAFYALDLDAPTSVEALTGPMGKESYPAWQVITYEFPAKGERPAVKITWYDGGAMPQMPKDAEGQFSLPDNGIIFIGDKGTMIGGGWASPPRLFPAARRKEFQLPAPTIARSPGHRQEWVKACIEKRPQDAKAGFWYSGPFTEALLVGVVAARLGKKIEWDGANMKAKNAPEAEGLIHKRYREGFGIR